MELSWGPKELEGAFGGAYRRYRIDGIEGKGTYWMLKHFSLGLENS